MCTDDKVPTIVCAVYWGETSGRSLQDDRDCTTSIEKLVCVDQ